MIPSSGTSCGRGCGKKLSCPLCNIGFLPVCDSLITLNTIEAHFIRGFLNMPKRSEGLRIATVTIAMAITATLGSGQTPEADLKALPTFTNGVAAYIYGFPLVMFGLTERAGITVPTASATLGGAPLNQFGKEGRLPDATFIDVVLPSTTTLYASAFINLKAEPLILHIPDFSGRFFLLQMLDGWTNVSDQSPGTRLGSKEGDYALVGPDWKGDLPFVKPKNVIRMDTNSMWIIGRIYTNGSMDDINDIKMNIYPYLTLTPLSAYGNYTPPSNLPLDPSVDTETSPLRQAHGMDACAFYGLMASMMKYNGPLAGDEKMVERLAQIGITPGKAFDCTILRESQNEADNRKLRALQLAVVTARDIVQNFQQAPTAATNYWLMPLDVGTYGQQYLLRAEVAEDAFGANNPQDAVYGYGVVDSGGDPVDGSHNYVIHFNAATSKKKAGEIPPVHPKAFWSVTIYNADGTLVANNIVHYNAIGIPQVQEHDACFNPDQSLDLYLQAGPPASGTPFCNWLPIPDKGRFIVFLRMYWPQNAVLNGKWVPPGIQKVN
jgi:hypothetical protein